ncbi:MAG: hypothetical protein R2752_08900 [Vicinamibacterales bacterium]
MRRAPWHVLRLGIVLLALSAVACGSSKAAADAALQSAQDAFEKVRADAERYAPDQAKAARESLESARAAVQRGDYREMLRRAPELATQITQLAVETAKKQETLVNAWNDLNAALPAKIESLRARASELGRRARLPEGVTRDAVRGANDAIAALDDAWQKAVAAAKKGDYPSASQLAARVQAMLADLMRALGLSSSGDAG